MNSSKEEIICVREDKAYHHQMRPYGILGPPYIITKHTLLYPSSRIKLSWQLLEKKRLTDQLNKCFPSVYVIGHAASLILNSVIQIVLQIVLMSTNAALWYVASGIWGGVYFLCIGLWSIYLGIYYCLNLFFSFDL